MGNEVKEENCKCLEEIPANPWGERNGGKDAKGEEMERISSQVLWLEWRGKVGRPGTDTEDAQGRKEAGERCGVPTITAERRDGGTWKNRKEKYGNAKVV